MNKPWRFQFCVFCGFQFCNQEEKDVHLAGADHGSEMRDAVEESGIISEQNDIMGCKDSTSAVPS